MSRKPDYQSLLQQLKNEIKELHLPAFGDPDSWTLTQECENGVEIGYDIPSPTDRKLLHNIGQRYGLIALCPNEVIDLDYAVAQLKMTAVVTTAFGKLPIRPRHG